MTRKKDPAAVKLGRRGGKAKTPAKRAAALEREARKRQSGFRNVCPKCQAGWSSKIHQACKLTREGE